MKTIQQILNEQLILLERLRTPKEFDLNKLKDFTDINDRINYARGWLGRDLFLGSGSDREVFIYSPKKALKVARSERGYLQNKAEIENQSPYTTKIFNFGVDKDGNVIWLISELVRKIKSSEEFKKFTGLLPWDLIDCLNRYKLKFVKSLSDEQKKWFLGLKKFVKEKNLLPEDLYYNQWGVTPDRRVVILDSGFTREVAFGK